MGDAARPKLSELLIRSTETWEKSRGDRIALSVFCPARGSSTPLETCHTCSGCHGFRLDPDARGGRLTCHVVQEGRRKVTAEAPDPIAPEALTRERSRDGMLTKVAEIMDTRTLCIEGTFPVDELMPLLAARNVSRVPVVDSRGGPLGILTRTDLLLRKHLDLTYRHASSVRQVIGTRHVKSDPPESDVPRVRTVSDVMTSGAFVLSEAAPVARAAALMAYEGVESILIISQQGRVVGLLSALDIANWVARSHGFALAPG
jgi:CBS domain-containing protein